jgi:hypothetical protein
MEVDINNKIACLICGKKFIKPLAHVWQKHNMSAREYKEEFDLPKKTGLITEEHRELLRQNLQLKSIQTIKEAGKKSRFIKGDKRAGRYIRTEAQKQRLREHIKQIRKNNKEDKIWKK